MLVWFWGTAGWGMEGKGNAASLNKLSLTTEPNSEISPAVSHKLLVGLF